ncbi:hypothetical protein GCM10020219_070620 [Nonomuraea dietziae]
MVVRTGIQFGRLRAPVQPVSGATSCLWQAGAACSEMVRGMVAVNGAFGVGGSVGLLSNPVHAIPLALAGGYAAQPFGRQPSVGEPQPLAVPAEGEPYPTCQT